ncbi:MAG: VTT domain-containing protein, partial [Gammaproteobacteria bacterium]
MRGSRVAPAVAIVLAVGAFFAFGLHRELTFESLARIQGEFAVLVDRRPLFSAAAYFAIYVAVTALSLPGAALMTLLGGALFGLGWGTLIVSFASTLGATLAFLAARFFFRAPLQRRFRSRLAAIDEGVARDGAFDLFTLRLVPVFPFVLVNLLVALTALPVRTFWWVSQLGMLPGTVVYVNAGTQLGKLDSLAGITSPVLLASFAALGLLPLLTRRLVERIRARRAQSRWQRPKRFDRNLIVIGAGSAGLVTAYISATVKASVTLIERDRMGGDCLNTGCVPSKALIRTAKLIHQARHAS